MAAVILILCVCMGVCAWVSLCYTLLCPKPLNPSGKQHCLLRNKQHGQGQRAGGHSLTFSANVLIDVRPYWIPWIYSWWEIAASWSDPIQVMTCSLLFLSSTQMYIYAYTLRENIIYSMCRGESWSVGVLYVKKKSREGDKRGQPRLVGSMLLSTTWIPVMCKH